MASNSGVRDGRNFDTDDGAADELEPSPGQRALEIARVLAFHIRRPVVFAPIFGVAYLAIAFLWYQGIQAEHVLEGESDSQLALLSQPAPKPELLLKQIEGWETAYEVTLDSRISRPLDSQLIGRVIDAAESAGLVVIETGTNQDGIAKLENDRYTVTPLLLKANGTLDGVERFLDELETDRFEAFELQAAMFNAELVGYILTLPSWLLSKREPTRTGPRRWKTTGIQSHRCF